jgi:hypothetical protein
MPPKITKVDIALYITLVFLMLVLTFMGVIGGGGR